MWANEAIRSNDSALSNTNLNPVPPFKGDLSTKLFQFVSGRC
jgi:hypothetical protein